MEILIKIAAIGGIGLFCAGMLKKTSPEMSLAAAIITQIVLAGAGAGLIRTVFSFIRTLAERAEISDELLIPLFKTVGISIITKISCDVCRDGGISAYATYIELCGGALAVSFAIPLIMTVLSLITS